MKRTIALLCILLTFFTGLPINAQVIGYNPCSACHAYPCRCAQPACAPCANTYLPCSACNLFPCSCSDPATRCASSQQTAAYTCQPSYNGEVPCDPAAVPPPYVEPGCASCNGPSYDIPCTVCHCYPCRCNGCLPYGDPRCTETCAAVSAVHCGVTYWQMAVAIGLVVGLAAIILSQPHNAHFH